MCLILHILLVVFEVRLMKKYDFSLDGIPISVITSEDSMTVRRAVADSLCDGGYAVFIYPVDNADFGITCIDKNNIEITEPYLPLTALFCFFKDVRHLPDITLEVLHQGIVYEVVLHGGKIKFDVNVGKCKIICTKTAVFDGGIEIFADVMNDGNVCVCTLCHDCDLFGLDRLGELPLRLGMRRDTPAVAISYDGTDCIKCVSAIPFYRAVAFAVSLLKRSGNRLSTGNYTAVINSFEHSFSVCADKLTFYPNIKYLY